MTHTSEPATGFSYLKYLCCSDCRKEFPVEQVQTYCPHCHAALLACYDLEALRAHVTREELASRPAGQWRWHEVLPVRSPEHCVTLGEGDTPLRTLQELGRSMGLPNLFLKDESVNATGLAKARGLSVAISKAREMGITDVLLPTAGHAGKTMAMYAAKAGLKAHVFMSQDAPAAYVEATRQAGAEVALVTGLINETSGIGSSHVHTGGWFDLSSFKEPYRLEGKKILGYEIAEAFKWELPEVIIYPVGSGAGLVGMWKAFIEMEELGWLENSKRPRLVAVQAKGCAPVVKALKSGSAFCDFWTNARTIATGLRVPKSFADRLVLQALYDSDGTAVAVSDEAIQATQQQMSETEGLALSPEGAATLAGLIKLMQQKWIRRDERIVLFNTGAGAKINGN